MMAPKTKTRWAWLVIILEGAVGAPGCEPVAPESQLRLSPSSLTVTIGGSQDFSGIVRVGTPYGTWIVQPNSISIAQIEVTGPLTARLTCFQEGAGAFVLSTLTSQGMVSGSLYFICRY